MQEYKGILHSYIPAYLHSCFGRQADIRLSKNILIRLSTENLQNKKGRRQTKRAKKRKKEKIYRDRFRDEEEPIKHWAVAEIRNKKNRFVKKGKNLRHQILNNIKFASY